MHASLHLRLTSPLPTDLSSLQARLGPEPLPLAKVVPLVSGVAQETMAPASPAIPAIARLDSVGALAAAVYSCGAPF